MPLEINNALRTQLAKLEQDALLDLYTIDLSNLTDKNNVKGSVYYLHNGVNEKKGNVVWKGVEYTPYPIKGSSFAKNSQGTSNRPKLTLSNMFGFVTTLVNRYDDCLGATVIRRQVYADNLDPVNFESGVNEKHNPVNEIITTFVIEQVEALTTETVVFVLAVPTELDGLLLPNRMMMADTCQYIYRSSECGYTGGAVADEKDQPTLDIKKDKCSKCLNGCRLRNNVRNFGAFIAINKL